jgi:hypothetical protein
MDIFLYNLWRDISGLPELPIEPFDLSELKRTEWNAEFEKLCRNRLVMGAPRYGKLGDPDKPNWDRLSRIEYEIKMYRIDGNDERLCDISNMTQLEFTEGNHPKKHFKALDDQTHNKVR